VCFPAFPPQRNIGQKTHHRGLEPRLSIPATPPECVAQFSICFLDGEETTIVPFVDFGHHIVRLRFSKEEVAYGWEKEREQLPKFEVLQVREKPKK
jgi:hypothetical protein